MASLLVKKGQFEGQAFDFAGGEIVIGRDETCSIMLENDSMVSRHHAKVFCDDKGVWCLADLGSANGTLLNNVAVATSPLKENDSISVGGTTFIFKNSDNLGPANVPPPAPPSAAFAPDHAGTREAEPPARLLARPLG